MDIKTIKNDPADRYVEGHFELENELRPIWLGSVFWNIYFEDEKECNIEEVRQLLDEIENDDEQSTC